MIPDRSQWLAAPAICNLRADEVHVWRATLDLPAQSVEQLEPLLSADERERARRFHFERDRRRWVIARGWLRTLLGRYLAAAPETLSFHYGRFGKPQVTNLETALEFNVSHSGEILLIAVTLRRAVGVDVERIRPDLSVIEIAERFFSPAECSALAALPPDVQPDAFFDCWTRKEAYIKARGDCLALPLHQFDVAFLPGEPAELLATRPDAAEASRWRLSDLRVADGYKAALAVEGSQWTLACWDWPGERA
jgi:4'-phosphopantetheinyl transferase